MSAKKKKDRDIPNTYEIKMFYHCGKCAPLRPAGVSPKEWVSVEVGSTVLGIQVWCKRCECNVLHVDFEGQKHPANMTRKGDDPSVKVVAE